MGVGQWEKRKTDILTTAYSLSVMVYSNVVRFTFTFNNTGSNDQEQQGQGVLQSDVEETGDKGEQDHHHRRHEEGICESVERLMMVARPGKRKNVSWTLKMKNRFEVVWKIYIHAEVSFRFVFFFTVPPATRKSFGF